MSDSIKGMGLILFVFMVYLVYRYWRAKKQPQATHQISENIDDAPKPSPPIDKATVFQKAAGLVFFLALLSIGSSNIISALALASFNPIEPISLVLIPIYGITAYFIRRESFVAYQIAFAAFVISSLISLSLLIMNGRQGIALLGDGTFQVVAILNVLYVMLVGFLFLNWYQLLRTSL